MSKVNMKFKGIELIEKVVVYPQAIASLPPSEEIDYTFTYLVDVKLDALQKMAVTITDITIDFAKDTSIKLAKFKTFCAFEFPEFEEVFIKTNDDKYEVPVDIEILLKSTGLSTTRGIIFAEVRGTYLHNAILPLIDLITPIREEHRKREEEKKSNPQ